VPKGQLRDIAAETKFINLLHKFNKTSRIVHNSASNAGRYAPALFAADSDSGGFSKAEFKRAMNRLFDTERIRLDNTRNGTRIVEHQ